MENLPSTRAPPIAAIFWDFENVRVYGHALFTFLETLLRAVGVHRVVKMCFARWYRVATYVRNAIRKAGFTLAEVTRDGRNALDENLVAAARQVGRLVNLTQVVLVSGDGDYLPLCSEWKAKGIDILVVARLHMLSVDLMRVGPAIWGLSRDGHLTQVV